MINTKLTRKAMIIAYNAHMNQLDKAGVPYIYHPIHLAEQMDTELECIVALLHDVVEDTDITFEQLEKEFSKEVITILKLLTRDKGEEYMDYIKKIKKHSIARKIKIEYHFICTIPKSKNVLFMMLYLINNFFDYSFHYKVCY